MSFCIENIYFEGSDRVQRLIDEVIRVYVEQGIVTRNEVYSLDSRLIGRGLQEELEKRGYPEATYTEIPLPNYFDYSGVIFNSQKYTDEEVTRYMVKSVLHED